MRGVLLSDDEKEQIRALHKKDTSYSRIALSLNREFWLYNGGTRTKHTVKSFIHRDDGTVSRQVQIPCPLADLARNCGVDLSPAALSLILVDALRRKVSTPVCIP